MRPLSSYPVTGGSSPATTAERPLPTPGQRLRHVVQKVVNQRKALNRMRAGHCTTEGATALGRLEQWLACNPFPSERTVHAFPLRTSVVLCLPSNPGSATLLRELDQLLNP